jgi:hypothetical protein
MARNKFGAIKTTVEGVTFDSKREARRWQELKLLERAGEISRLERQVKFPLTVEGHLIANYTADFQYYTTKPKARVVEDVKGGGTLKLPAFVLKKKLMKAIYGIELLVTQ